MRRRPQQQPGQITPKQAPSPAPDPAAGDAAHQTHQRPSSRAMAASCSTSGGGGAEGGAEQFGTVRDGSRGRGGSCSTSTVGRTLGRRRVRRVMSSIGDRQGTGVRGSCSEAQPGRQLGTFSGPPGVRGHGFRAEGHQRASGHLERRFQPRSGRGIRGSGCRFHRGGKGEHLCEPSRRDRGREMDG